MTPELRKVLTDWLEWAEADAPEHPEFITGVGLCGSVPIRLEPELKRYLATDHDGQSNLPFGTLDEYWAEMLADAHHRNPKRLAWVRRVLEQANA